MCLGLWMCIELWLKKCLRSLVYVYVRRSLKEKQEQSTWALPKDLSKSSTLDGYQNVAGLHRMANRSRGGTDRFGAGLMAALSPKLKLFVSLKVKYEWMFLETTQNMINLILQPRVSLFTSAKCVWIAEGLKMHYNWRSITAHLTLSSIVRGLAVVTLTMIMQNQAICARLSSPHFLWQG